MARQCSQYLSETSQTLSTAAYAVSDLPSIYQHQFLSEITATYPRFTALYLLNSKGRVQVEAANTRALSGLDLSRERFFAPAIQARAPYFSTPFISLSTQHIAVTGVIPILRGGELRGLLVGELDLGILQQTVETVEVGEQGESFILDPQGTFVAHPNPAWVHEQKNISNLPLFQQADSREALFQIFYDQEREAWLIGSARQIEWGWVIMTTQPLSVAARPLILLLVISVLAFGGSIALFIWAQLTSAHRISEPILRLTQDVDRLASGEHPASQAHHYYEFREVISLYQRFTHMADAIRERTTALEQTNTALNTLNAELEMRVRQRTADLELVNQDLSSFAYVVSHDLKAPLRAIGRLTHWLVTDYAAAFDEHGKEMSALLIGRVKRMDNLIEGILEYSRIGRLEGAAATVDLNQVVEEVLDSLAPPDHITIRILHELPTLVLNRTRITQVFQNLLSNAITFLDKPQGDIMIDCAADGDGWVFSIRDNGPGIDPKYFDRIFQIFQTLQARDTLESTGIGLSLVKRIIEWYGGRVWVESTPGQGSVFWFRLPKTPSPIQKP